MKITFLGTWGSLRKFACYGLFGFGFCVTYALSIKEQVKKTFADNLNIFCSFGDYDISVGVCHNKWMNVLYRLTPCSVFSGQDIPPFFGT